MPRLLRFAIAALASAIIILILTFGTYALHLWVGGHLSVRDFLLRSLMVFPIVIGLVAGLWPSPQLNCGPLRAGIVGAFVGLAYGYLAPRVMFSYGVRHWVGFGRLAWQIDGAALLCGATAGICAMLLSITARSRITITSVAIITVTAVLLPAPTFDLISHSQELTIAIVTPNDTGVGSKKPDVVADVYSTPVDVDNVTNRVLHLLRNGGVTDTYRVSNVYRQGHGRSVFVVVVLSHPIVNTVHLREPCGGDVIYLEGPDGWKKIPSQIPTLSRSLTLEPPIVEEAIAGLTITEAGGWSTGVQIWKPTN